MRKTAAERKDEYIQDLVNARRAILDLVKTIPSERLDEPFLGIWSIKDLLAHLAGWDFTNLQAIQEIQAGQVPAFFHYYDKDWQTYNARLVQTYRREPFEALLSEVEDSHRQLVAYLQMLSPKDLAHGKVRGNSGRTVTTHNLLQSEASDEWKHAEQIRGFFGIPV